MNLVFPISYVPNSQKLNINFSKRLQSRPGVLANIIPSSVFSPYHLWMGCALWWWWKFFWLARGLFLPFLPITLPTLLMDGLAGVERGRSRKISRAGFLDFLSIISSQKISLGTAWAGLIILSDSMILSDNLSFTTPKQPSNDKPTKTIQLYPKS